MKIVSQAIEREQNQIDVDDSCFDSCEYAHTLTFINPAPASPLRMLIMADSYPPSISIKQFWTENGVIRSPKSKYGYTDTSGDQEFMFFLAARRINGALAAAEDLKVISRGWRTGNANFVSPGFFCFLKNWEIAFNICMMIQILFFWIPIRWDDGRKRPVFGFMNQCGDYRLFIQLLPYTWWVVRYAIRKNTLKKMTMWYWLCGEKMEPNAQWTLEAIFKFIDLI